MKAVPPIWMLYIMPTYLPIVWLVDILLVCGIVALSLKAMKKAPITPILRVCLVRCVIFTYLAQLVGTALMAFSAAIDFLLPAGSAIKDFWYQYITNFIAYNPLGSVPATTWALLCLIVSGLLIYVLNMRFAFNKTELNKGAKKRISLALVLAMSPYLFLIPTVFIFR